MFRAPPMKTLVYQLRFDRLMLRHTHVWHEGAVCSGSVSRGGDLQQWEQHRRFYSSSTPTYPHSRCSVPGGFPVVLHTSEWIRTRISASFLLTRFSFSCAHWIRTPKTFALFLHAPFNSSPPQLNSAVNLSRCLLPKTTVEKSPNCPESHIKRQTCCCVLIPGSSHSGGFQGLANSSLGVWTRSIKTVSRPAVLSLQTRGLHRSTQQRTATDECLSAPNEARCKHVLQANAALYEQEEKSWAAVLVCLCAVSGHPALLFTLRSAKLKGRHKGDVSFAGGKKDASDRTVVDTALREAREELGIHVTEDQVWGVLKPLREATGMMIAPVIANLGPLEALSFQPNPSEVEEIFTLTLEHLCQPQNRGYTHFRTGDRYGYTLPVFHSLKYRVWGLTAVALDQTLKVIVPPKRLLDHRLLQ